MKEIKLFRLFAAFLLLFVLCNGLRAEEKQPIQFTPAKMDDREARLKQIAEEKAKQGKRLKEIELTRQEKQNRAKQIVEEEARKEVKRLEAEARAQARQQDSALEEAKAQAPKEKEAEEKRFTQEAERKVKEAKLAWEKEKRQAQLKARNEERLKREAQRKAKEAQGLAQKEKEAQDKRLKLEAERKAGEERLAGQKEGRLKEATRTRQLKEALLKANQEKLAREKQDKLEKLAGQKEERLKEIARVKEEKEAQRKAWQEEKLKAEAQRKAKEAQGLAQKEKEAQDKRLKLEAERQAEEERLAREKQEKLEEEARQREEKLDELAWEREQREADFRIRQEELAREREERLEEIAWEREQREADFLTHQEELASLETDRKIQEAQLQAEQEEQKQMELFARQEELAQQREEAEARINEAKRDATQEKIITEAMLKKQKEDQAKIEKIEKLWKRARKLYDQERYEDAIQDFQKIIELEGNPRIKYTPEAKGYIEKAKLQMELKKRAVLYDKVELSEGQMINEVVDKQIPPYVEPPQSVEQPKEPTFLIEPPAIRKKLKATKITMDFDKVGLKSVIVFLAQESGINIIASQRVLELAPVVSARLKDATLDEVIKYITKNLGLVYRVDKELVWIASPEEITNEPMETRIYYLNKGGGLFTEFSPMSTGTSETGLGGSSAQIDKVFTIEDTLKEVIPWPSDSKISYDKRLNALLVRNTPQNLEMLEDILYNMDIEPLQVLIEARFIEVDITDTKELGMDWNIAKGDWKLKEREGNFKAGLGQNTGVDFTAFTRATEGFNLNYIGMLTNSQFKAVLHALEESKKIKTLSSPRITTLNNQIATIKVVDEWIYPTRYEFEILQVPGQLPSQTPTYEYKNVPKDFIRRDVGILLKVIPAVGADKKTINLSLIPEVSEGIADGFTYTGDVKLPKFTSRNLSTSVVVSSGDTVVLGGMIKENRTKTLTKVPLLGDIPFIGGLFRKNTDSIERKNLLIFVTAKVLSSSGEEVIVAQK